jgi:hypothetical protein
MLKFDNKVQHLVISSGTFGYGERVALNREEFTQHSVSGSVRRVVCNGREADRERL